MQTLTLTLQANHICTGSPIESWNDCILFCNLTFYQYSVTQILLLIFCYTNQTGRRVCTQPSLSLAHLPPRYTFPVNVALFLLRKEPCSRNIMATCWFDFFPHLIYENSKASKCHWSCGHLRPHFLLRVQGKKLLSILLVRQMPSVTKWLNMLWWKTNP